MTAYNSDFLLVEPYVIGDSQLADSSVEETVPIYDAEATYAQLDLVRDDIAHLVYESQIDGNIGHPLSDGGYWVKVGPTNRTAMFDPKNSTQTIDVGEIVTELQLSGRVDTVALLNISASTVQIVIGVPGAELIYSPVYELVDYSEIVDYWEYCFAEVVRKNKLIVADLPLVFQPLITVIASSPGGMVAIGTLLIGQSKYLGVTSLGATFDIQDFSFKQRDPIDGTFEVVERDYADLLSFSVQIENAMLDSVRDALIAVRAKPCLWIATNRYASAAAIAFYQRARITATYPEHSDLAIDLEGLT